MSSSIVELKSESDGVAFGAEGMNDFAVFAGSYQTTNARMAFDAPSREAVFHSPESSPPWRRPTNPMTPPGSV